MDEHLIDGPAICSSSVFPRLVAASAAKPEESGQRLSHDKAAGPDTEFSEEPVALLQDGDITVDIANHHYATCATHHRIQFEQFLIGPGKGFFAEHVFTGLYRLPDKLDVCTGRGADDNRLNGPVFKDITQVCGPGGK